MFATHTEHSTPARPAWPSAPPTLRRSAARPSNPAWDSVAMALPVSRPGDASEIEADRVADAVMRGAAPGGIGSAAGAAPLHRACAACEDDEPRLQRQADGSTGRPSAAGIGGWVPAKRSMPARGAFLSPAWAMT